MKIIITEVSNMCLTLKKYFINQLIYQIDINSLLTADINFIHLSPHTATRDVFIMMQCNFVIKSVLIEDD